jgi:hypothetical protein
MISTKAIQINNLREQLLKQGERIAALEIAVAQLRYLLSEHLSLIPANFPFIGIDPAAANESRTAVFVPPAEETSLQSNQSS